MLKNALPALLLGLSLVAGGGRVPESGLLQVQSIALPDVKGRIDHLAVDRAGERLFVAETDNNTVDVLDLRTGRRIHRISSLHEPQGVAFAERSGHLYVTNGGTGTVEIHDAATYGGIGRIQLFDDADNIRYDRAADRAYIGYGEGGLAVVDAAAGAKIGSVDLGAHPEAFQLEQKGPRIFVNVPSERSVAVVDRSSARVVARWPLAGARANFPMDLDEEDDRLFLGCREPALLLVLDTTSGRQVGGAVPIDGDPDDVFWDAPHKRIYVSCGAGVLDIIRQTSPDSYSVSARLPTAPGARTSLFVPELRRLFVAVPRQGRESAVVQVYAVG